MTSAVPVILYTVFFVRNPLFRGKRRKNQFDAEEYGEKMYLVSRWAVPVTPLTEPYFFLKLLTYYPTICTFHVFLSAGLDGAVICGFFCMLNNTCRGCVSLVPCRGCSSRRKPCPTERRWPCGTSRRSPDRESSSCRWSREIGLGTSPGRGMT